MKNWHDRLDLALDAGNVSHFFSIVGKPMPYNSILNMWHDGTFATVTRDDRGLYETAISYDTACNDTKSHIQQLKLI